MRFLALCTAALVVAGCSGGAPTDVTLTPPVTTVDYGHAVTSTTSSPTSISGFIRGYTSPTGRDSTATPLPGSVVEFLRVTAASPSTNRIIQRDGCNRTSTAVGSATTDATGSFQISGLADGLYDLRVTPPASSGYLVTAFCGANITAGAGLMLQLFFLKP